MKPRMVEYKPEHARRLLLEYPRAEELQAANGMSAEELAESQQKAGPAWTMLVGEEIIGCGGVILCGYKGGMAWLMLSKLFYSYSKSALKEIKLRLLDIAAEHKLRRIEMETVAESATNARFAEYLGFELEGRKRAYGPNGEDFFIFARLFDQEMSK